MVAFEDLPDDAYCRILEPCGPRALLDFCAASHRMATLPTEALWRSLCSAKWQAWPRYRLTPAREEWLNERKQEWGSSWLERYRRIERDVRRTVITQEELMSLHFHFNFTPAAGGRGRQTLKAARFTATNLLVPGYPPLAWHLIGEGGVGDEGDEAEAAGSDDDDDGDGPGPSSRRSASAAAGGGSSSSGGGASSPSAFSVIRQLMSSLMSSGSVPPAATRNQYLHIANFPPHWIERLADGEWLIYNDNVTFVSCGPDGPGSYDARGFLTDMSQQQQQQVPVN